VKCAACQTGRKIDGHKQPSFYASNLSLFPRICSLPFLYITPTIASDQLLTTDLGDLRHQYEVYEGESSSGIAPQLASEAITIGNIYSALKFVWERWLGSFASPLRAICFHLLHTGR
jgi:hypothetical protein